ncbi:DUF547 domain-containing protein [Arenibacter sp. GZD96]|uniref:DUF547 domain-containing protein n=1 Tax=Aurantibrevibacter litoralis TaxID=3106030 RepID=UPI002AFF115C|nr:DUF547 domain-containing protein [Arenibacter sp. GZD-96]MEA1786128.1 DUF547 domain-containing protein [Arenibacter sp. GZD-96]
MKFSKKQKYISIGGFTLLFLIVAFLLSTLTFDASDEIGSDYSETNLNALSETLLRYIKDGRSTTELQAQLDQISMETLVNGLASDAQKIAFWVNIYNAYIQILLSEHPELYKDKNAFFKVDQIPIAGTRISFAFIEHGILRKSQWELGGGYIHKWFTSKMERNLRVYQPDYRIHFALNCGAKDCPPVAIYEPGRLDDQFEAGTKRFLMRTTTLQDDIDAVEVTALFSWFRGDFGGKKGTLSILEEFQIISRNAAQSLSFKDYDWTLELDNFIDL